jgi:F-type H+-transporting ATPase subunit b
LVTEAKTAAKAERERLLDQAREDADAQRSRWHQALQNERESLSQALSVRTREEVFAIARKVLGDLAGTSLEERLADVFVRRLREIDGEMKAALSKALETTADPVRVRSAFELPAAQREAIETALREDFASAMLIRFETVPDLVSGIELAVNGQKLAWSIADYLISLEQGVDAMLQARDQPETCAGPTRDEDPESGASRQ